jgi:ABC-type transport system involved in multi-copper enzyme maturation permease subunit
MIAKELIDARWKAIVGMALALVTVLLGAFTFDIVKSALNSSDLSKAPSFLGDYIARLGNYDAYVWSQNYSITGNTGLILIIVALLIGGSLIANEVSKGTIFLLLSRPLSRDQIVLTKYLVGAVVLLCMNVLVGLVLMPASVIAGHSVDVAGVAVSALLFWLGTLFVLGLSTLFSVVFNDVLRPLALTVVVLIVLSLPGIFPNGGDWVLPNYWTSLPAFMGQEFPLKALLISLVAAILPIVAAVPLFRKQAY